MRRYPKNHQFPPRTLTIYGLQYASEDEAMELLGCSRKSLNAFLLGKIDHPYRCYLKHVEINGKLYKCHQDVCDELGITPRHLRWYLAGEATQNIINRIERKQND